MSTLPSSRKKQMRPIYSNSWGTSCPSNSRTGRRSSSSTAISYSFARISRPMRGTISINCWMASCYWRTRRWRAWRSRIRSSPGRLPASSIIIPRISLRYSSRRISMNAIAEACICNISVKCGNKTSRREIALRQPRYKMMWLLKRVNRTWR